MPGQTPTPHSPPVTLLSRPPQLPRPLPLYSRVGATAAPALAAAAASPPGCQSQSQPSADFALCMRAEAHF
eukprot:352826-Chlamydomonas_euryale.AAC.1